MGLTLEELEEIQDELMASDMEIDFERMRLWTREQATSYFETGEEPPPAWEPEPYLMGRLEKEGLGHLKESLREQTVAGLVELMRSDRAQFLPTLQKKGVTKLPDRQKVRDIIKIIANPPKGSEDKLREDYRAEFEIFPWARVESESHASGDSDANTEIASMVSQLPTDTPLQKYMIRNLADPSGITIQSCRASNSSDVGGLKVMYENGLVIQGDHESWSHTDPNLRVHVYVPNRVQPSMGYFQGWCNFVDLVPLDEAGNPPPKAVDERGKASVAVQRQIQRYFEHGYFQLSVCRAIRDGIRDKPVGMSFRQALDQLYMKVRGPALIRLGYMPNTSGLNEYMATVDPEDEVHNYAKLSDDDFKALMDSHNRIVALMGGMNPANIKDALAERRKGQALDMSAALEAEPEADGSDKDSEAVAAVPAVAEIS